MPTSVRWRPSLATGERLRSSSCSYRTRRQPMPVRAVRPQEGPDAEKWSLGHRLKLKASDLLTEKKIEYSKITLTSNI